MVQIPAETTIKKNYMVSTNVFLKWIIEQLNSLSRQRRPN